MAREVAESTPLLVVSVERTEAVSCSISTEAEVSDDLQRQSRSLLAVGIFFMAAAAWAASKSSVTAFSYGKTSLSSSSSGGIGSISGSSGKGIRGFFKTNRRKEKELSFLLSTVGSGRASRLADGVPDYPWAKLLEPHREATLEAELEGATGDEIYTWTIDGGEKTLQGQTVQFTPTRIGWHDIAITVTTTDGISLSSSAAVSTASTKVTERVMSKYVRRELRSLSDSERERVLDAMHSIYKYTTAEGQAKFASLSKMSSKFKDIAYFVSKHLKGGASLECDSWHDGAGYLNNHAAFSLEFEQAMQASDPTVALPYWDFTLDYHRQKYDGLDWRQGGVFQDSWFGAASPARKDHAVDGTGRWALTPVLKVDRSDPAQVAAHPISNPYGLLRSPWNANPTPFVARSDTVAGYMAFDGEMPSCESYDMCFVSSSAAVMNECLNGITHGPVHIEVGGLWHKDLSGKLGGTDSLLDGDLAYQLLLISKNLWRQGYMRCPNTCATSDEKTSNSSSEYSLCSCSCPAAAIGGASSYEVLTDKTGIMHWVAKIAQDGAVEWNVAAQRYRITGYENDPVGEAAVWDSLLHEVLCDPGHVGDMCVPLF
jgi:hypothetical protein